MTDRIALGPQNTAQVQALGGIAANERVVDVYENDDAGIIDVQLGVDPRYSAESFSHDASRLEAQLFVVSTALEQSDFAPAAPVPSTAAGKDNRLTGSEMVPSVGTGSLRMTKKNQSKLTKTAQSQTPSLSPRLKKLINKRTPRNKKQHMLLMQQQYKLRQQLQNTRTLQRAAMPAGFVRTAHISGEQAYNLVESTGAMKPGLSNKDRSIAWRERRYGYSPNRYKNLNTELNNLQKNIHKGPIPEGLRPTLEHKIENRQELTPSEKAEVQRAVKQEQQANAKHQISTVLEHIKPKRPHRGIVLAVKVWHLRYNPSSVITKPHLWAVTIQSRKPI